MAYAILIILHFTAGKMKALLNVMLSPKLIFSFPKRIKRFENQCFPLAIQSFPSALYFYMTRSKVFAMVQLQN